MPGLPKAPFSGIISRFKLKKMNKMERPASLQEKFDALLDEAKVADKSQMTMLVNEAEELVMNTLPGFGTSSTLNGGISLTRKLLIDDEFKRVMFSYNAETGERSVFEERDHGGTPLPGNLIEESQWIAMEDHAKAEYVLAQLKAKMRELYERLENASINPYGVELEMYYNSSYGEYCLHLPQINHVELISDRADVASAMLDFAGNTALKTKDIYAVRDRVEQQLRVIRGY